ncbi:MAG TPA: ATP-binding protein [Terriglobales bacterium]|nr:ATP-binding protein [Terriglobales bacterium]
MNHNELLVLFNLPVLFLILAALVLGVVAGWYYGRRRPQQSVTKRPDPQKADSSALSSHLLNTTLEEMREGLLVIDREMRVVTSNRAARQLVFTVTEDSIDSRRLTELTRNPAIYDAFLDGVRGTERSGVKVETHGASRRVFDLRVVPLRTADASEVSGALGVFFDVTRLERLEIVRQEFLSNVSHELRTPLTSIMALTETLEDGALSDTDNNRRFLSIIKKNASRMHRLIDDILELSAIEAGNVQVNREWVSLRPLVSDIVNSVSATVGSHKITINNEVPAEARVFADPHRLSQMLTNLIDNAVKFNRNDGSVTIRYAGNNSDYILVEDTGEGIPALHLDRLFERFYRVDRARSRELGGTGLGLAIVKHLAKAHGGEVSVESRFGEGSSFMIELPRQAQNGNNEEPLDN